METLAYGDEVSQLRGEVVCLQVAGNHAAVGFLVLESTGILALGQPEGTTHTLLVEDNVAGDTYGFVAISDCSTSIAYEPPYYPFERGSITIRG